MKPKIFVIQVRSGKLIKTKRKNWKKYDNTSPKSKLNAPTKYVLNNSAIELFFESLLINLLNMFFYSKEY